MTMRAKVVANRRNGVLSTGPQTAIGKAAVAKNAIKHGIFAMTPVLPDEDGDAWETHRAGVVESLGAVGLLEMNLAERVAMLLWRLARLARYESATTAADAEAANFPPDPMPFDELLHSGKEKTRTDQLATIRKQAKVSRDFVEELDAAAELASRLKIARGNKWIPMDRAGLLLETAFQEVTDRGMKCHSPGDTGFLAAIGDGQGDMSSVEWDADSIRRAFRYFEGCLGWDSGRMLREVENSVRRGVDAARCRCEVAEAELVGLETKSKKQRAVRLADAIMPGDEKEAKIIRYEAHLSRQLQMTLNQLERIQTARAGGFVPPPLAIEVGVSGDHPPTA